VADLVSAGGKVTQNVTRQAARGGNGQAGRQAAGNPGRQAAEETLGSRL